VNRLKKTKTVKFSPSTLETLAIIAYRQPVIRAEIEQIRGVDSGWVLRNLLEKGLIRIVGRKDLPGRPLVYGTTKAFLELFNLNSLSDLPALKEIQPPPSSEIEVAAQTGPEEEEKIEISGEDATEEKVEVEAEVQAETEAGVGDDPEVEPKAEGESEGES
jgi:segregation and condensation protein B